MLKAFFTGVLITIGVSSQAQVKSPGFVWGINGHPLTQLAYKGNLSTQIDLLNDMKVNSYRFDVLLDEGGYAKKESQFNEVLQALKSNKMDALPVLMQSGLKGLSNPDIYQKSVTQGRNFATKYGSYLSVIEVNNEADNKMLLPGDPSGTKAKDYDTVKSARIIAAIKGFIDGVKQVKPAVKVSLSVSYIHYYYLQLLKDNNVNYDIIGCHWYSNMGQITRANPNGDNALKIITERFRKPIWLTEFNYSKGTSKATFQKQDTYFSTTLPDIIALGYIKGLFIYELFDEPDLKQRYPFEAGYGLVTQGANGGYLKKDAYATYKRIVQQY